MINSNKPSCLRRLVIKLGLIQSSCNLYKVILGRQLIDLVKCNCSQTSSDDMKGCFTSVQECVTIESRDTPTTDHMLRISGRVGLVVIQLTAGSFLHTQG